MARYRANAPMFINGARIRVGQEFSFAGPPNKDMEPLDAEAAKLMERLKVGAASVAAPAKAETVKAEPVKAEPFGLEVMGDDELRAFIETKGGKMPGAKASRETLLNAARLAGGDGVA